MFLAYIFKTIMEPLLRPFGLTLLLPPGLFLPSEIIHCMKPVAKLGSQTLHLSSRRCSPSGPFNPSGS